MKHPKISVVMPVYNGEKYLKGAIDSILKQDLDDFEFIIINDGSNDSTAEILENYQRIDNRIHVITNYQNVGASFSRNKGINIAKAKYIALMDADDICLPNRLSKGYSFLKEHPEIGVVGSGHMIIDKYDKVIGSFIFPENNAVIKWHTIIPDRTFSQPSVMSHSSILLGAGGYSQEYDYSEDYDLWSRLTDQTIFANLSECLLMYRRHEEQASNSKRTIQIQNCVKICGRNLDKLLSRKVSRNLVAQLVKAKVIDPQDRLSIATLISEARSCFFNQMKNEITEVEKKIINKEVSRSLLYLIHWRKLDFASLQIIFRALKLNPLSLSSFINEKKKKRSATI